MPGKPDPHYVVAREVLLDAIEALGPQLPAVILVGAQAVYFHTGAIDLAVAEFTTDADLVLDPSLLQDHPEIASALHAAGFHPGNRVGAWITERRIDGVDAQVEVDLMVPEAVGGAGRRAARLTGHARQTARKARGLEASLLDKGLEVIGALDAADRRTFTVQVAGPAALLVSKLHKINDRRLEGRVSRLDDKDALDVLRLLRAVTTAALASSLTTLRATPPADVVTTEAIHVLNELFGNMRGAGCVMAARAGGALVDPDEIAASASALALDLLAALRSDI